MASRALNPERLAAFTDELVKVGGIQNVGKLGRFLLDQSRGVGRGISAVGEAMDPRRTGTVLSRGWRHFEPIEGRVQGMLRKLERAGITWDDFAAKNGLPKDPYEAVRQDIRAGAERASQGIAADQGAPKPSMLSRAGRTWRKRQAQVTSAHLADESQPLSAVWRDPKALAEELSRRGWTGQGKMTRYMPVGGKSWTAGFGLGLLPAAAGKEDPYGEGRGRFERLGEHTGMQAGFVAGMPASLLGGFAASELGRRGLGTAGKGLDMLTGHRKQVRQGQGE